MLEHLGYPVTRLIRLAYGPFQLGHLARGAIEEVPARCCASSSAAGSRLPERAARAGNAQSPIELLRARRLIRSESEARYPC